MRKHEFISNSTILLFLLICHLSASWTYLPYTTILATRKRFIPCYSSRTSTSHESKSRTSLSNCERITSKEASKLISQTYDKGKGKGNGDNDNDNGESNLLVITSDASRGANRFTGLASILREIRYQKNDK